MAQKKSIGKQFSENLRAAKAKQDSERARRRAEKALEGTPAERAVSFAVRWGKRAFYTAFMVMAVYLIIMFVTLLLPAVMALIIGMLGYTLSSMGEIMLTGFCGLFFVLWMFALSFLVVWQLGKIYMRAMRATAKSAGRE